MPVPPSSRRPTRFARWSAALRPVLAACALAGASLAPALGQPAPTAREPARAEARPDMGERIACFARSGGAAVSAHRGGPAGPENSLSAVAASVAAGVLVVEIDVGLARDGTVVALHDRTLERTTTGTGPLAAQTRRSLARLTLKDRAGAITAEPVPTLAAVLAAARGRAVVSIDLKPSVGSSDPGRAQAFARLVRAVGRTVRAAGAREEVMLIAYSVDEARVIRQLLPWADLSVSARSQAELDAYREAGIDPARAMVFAGVLRPAQSQPEGEPGQPPGPVRVRLPHGRAHAGDCRNPGPGGPAPR
jgi:glycerophosphoryl diester phosphodiesterase